MAVKGLWEEIADHLREEAAWRAGRKTDLLPHYEAPQDCYEGEYRIYMKASCTCWELVADCKGRASSKPPKAAHRRKALGEGNLKSPTGSLG